MELPGGKCLQTRPALLDVEVGVHETVFEKNFEEEVGVETAPILAGEGVALMLSTFHLLHEHVHTTAPPVYALLIPRRGSTST